MDTDGYSTKESFSKDNLFVFEKVKRIFLLYYKLWRNNGVTNGLFKF